MIFVICLVHTPYPYPPVSKIAPVNEYNSLFILGYCEDYLKFASTNCAHCYVNHHTALFCKLDAPITSFPESMFELCPNIDKRVYFVVLNSVNISELNVEDFILFPRALSFSFDNNPLKCIWGTSIGKKLDKIEDMYLGVTYLGGGENTMAKVADGTFDGMFSLRTLNLKRSEVLW